MILAAIIGFGLGDTCLLKSISLIGVSRSYTIAYTSPLFTMVLATVLLGEPFLLQYLVGTVIIFFGIMLVSVNDNNEGPRRSYRELLAAFATALLWSIGMIFIAVGLEDVSVISANTIRFPFLFVFLFAVSRLWKRKLNLSRRNLALLGTSGILGMTLAGMTFLYSIQFNRGLKSDSTKLIVSCLGVLDVQHLHEGEAHVEGNRVINCGCRRHILTDLGVEQLMIFEQLFGNLRAFLRSL